MVRSQTAFPRHLTIVNILFTLIFGDPLLRLIRDGTFFHDWKIPALAAGNSDAGGDAAYPAQCGYDTGRSALPAFKPAGSVEARPQGAQWSIRINDQWRVCFRFERGDVFDVEIVDYH